MRMFVVVLSYLLYILRSTCYRNGIVEGRAFCNQICIHRFNCVIR